METYSFVMEGDYGDGDTKSVAMTFTAGTYTEILEQFTSFLQSAGFTYIDNVSAEFR